MNRGQTVWIGLIALFFLLYLISMFAGPLQAVITDSMNNTSTGVILPNYMTSMANVIIPILFFIAIYAFVTLIAPGVGK